MERETGFEPATSTLARSHSTTELFPLGGAKPHHSILTRGRSTRAVDHLGRLWYDWGSVFRVPRIRSAPSPRGKAEVCKTSIPGSNPGGASNFF